MGDDLLNGRKATDWEQAAVADGRRDAADRDAADRDAAVVAGLLAEYPRDAVPVPRPVTDAPLPVLP